MQEHPEEGGKAQAPQVEAKATFEGQAKGHQVEGQCDEERQVDRGLVEGGRGLPLYC